MWKKLLSAIVIASFIYSLYFFSEQANYGAYTEYSSIQIGGEFKPHKNGAGASFSFEAFLAFIFYVVFLAFITQDNFTLVHSKKIHTLKRIGAFLIDLTVLYSLMATSMIIILLSIEAVKTGSFNWYFIRETRNATDTLYEIFFGFWFFFLLLYYFYWHLKQQRPTIGQYLLGFKIYHKKSLSTFDCIIYIYSAMMHIPFFPVVIYKAIFKNMAWWDRKSQTETIAINLSNTIFQKTKIM